MIFKKGEPFEGVNKQYQEGSRFDFDDSGAILLYFYNKPTEDEIRNFAEGKTQFRVFISNGIIFFLSRFGSLPWNDSPYNVKLSKNLTNIESPMRGQGFGLTCMMIDASNGTVKHIRYIGLQTDFSKALKEAIKLQPDIPDYDSILASLYRTYSTQEMAMKAQIKQ